MLIWLGKQMWRWVTVAGMFGLLVALGSALPPLSVYAAEPSLGVIRWDTFNTEYGIPDKNSLAPRQYQDRVPYYLDIEQSGSGYRLAGTENRAELIDEQIQYASASGIDYWAFVSGSDFSPSASEHYALNHYLHSPYKSLLQFSLIVNNYPAVTDKWAAWSDRVDQMIEWFADPDYVKVAGGRPLIYFYRVTDVEKYFAAGLTDRAAIVAATKPAFELVRTRATAAGLANPYIVTMDYANPTGLMDDYGLDAISRYGFAPTAANYEKISYAEFAEQNRALWQSQLNTGKKMIPEVSLGWDQTPRWQTPPPWGAPVTPLVEAGSPSQLVAHIKDGLDFAKTNPTAVEANTALVYAWNEFAEGGWLAPTKGQGFERLDALKAMRAGQGVNLLANPGFEADMAANVQSPAGWSEAGANPDAGYTNAGGHSWGYKLLHYKTSAYQVYTYQKLSGLDYGDYTVTAWVYSSGGQNAVYMDAQEYGGTARQQPITSTAGWSKVTIPAVRVATGQLVVGFYSNASAGQWLQIDDVAVTADAPDQLGLIRNGSFESRSRFAQTPIRWSETGGQPDASFVEPGGHTGGYRLTHYQPVAYQAYTSQTITGITYGTYTLRAWVRSSGGQPSAYMEIKNYGGAVLRTAINASESWQQVSISGIEVAPGQQPVVGFYSNALAGQWLHVDDVSLVPGVPAAPLATVIVDNTSAGFSTVGTWSTSSSSPGFEGTNYAHDGTAGADTGKTAKWTPELPAAGSYKVYMKWTSGSNRPAAVPVEIKHGGASANMTVNQQVNGSVWVELGAFNFTAAAADNYVLIDASDTGYTIADAVKFVQQ